MDNKSIKIGVILIFSVGMAFYVAAIATFPDNVVFGDLSKPFASFLLGTASMFAATIGATQMKR